MTRLQHAACLLVASLLPACNTGPSSDGADGGVGGRGTAECQTWKTALCDYEDRCSPSTSTCRSTAPAVACKSDQLASDCAIKLRTASCSTPPSGCALLDLADPAPAITGCNRYAPALCSSDYTCGVTAAQCEAQIAAQLDCSKAIGLEPLFEQCLTDVKVLTCGTQAQPDSCNGAVLLSSPSASCGSLCSSAS